MVPRPTCDKGRKDFFCFWSENVENMRGGWCLVPFSGNGHRLVQGSERAGRGVESLVSLTLEVSPAGV